jgi:hypothetical protein
VITWGMGCCLQPAAQGMNVHVAGAGSSMAAERRWATPAASRPRAGWMTSWVRTRASRSGAS